MAPALDWNLYQNLFPRPGLQSWAHLNSSSTKTSDHPSQRQMAPCSNTFKDSPKPTKVQLGHLELVAYHTPISTYQTLACLRIHSGKLIKCKYPGLILRRIKFSTGWKSRNFWALPVISHRVDKQCPSWKAPLVPGETVVLSGPHACRNLGCIYTFIPLYLCSDASFLL